MGVCLRTMFSALAQRGVESFVQAAAGNLDRSAIPDGTWLDPPATTPGLREFDLVCFHGWGTSVALRVARLARAARRPYLISPHGDLTPGPFRRDHWVRRIRRAMLENRLVRDAAALISLSSHEADELRRRLPKSRVIQLPYGLEFASYAPDAEPTAPPSEMPSGRFLLMLGPLEPVEGGVALLKAAAELGKDIDGWSVVLAGPDRGTWRAMLQAAVHRKGGEGRVVFSSACDLPAQRAWLRAAAAVVAPSLHIRVPVSIMQAAAAGRAIVATDCVVPDELRETVSVCRTNRAHLREALRSLVTIGDSERASTGERARKAGRALDWAALADRYVEAYQSVI